MTTLSSPVLRRATGGLVAALALAAPTAAIPGVARGEQWRSNGGTPVRVTSPRATRTGLRKVCHRFSYVARRPGAGTFGTLFRGQHIRVRRVSPSARYAYGRAFGHVGADGWVKVSDLCV